MNWANNIENAERRERVEATLAKAELVGTTECNGAEWLSIAMEKTGETGTYHHAMLYPINGGLVDWERDSMFVGCGCNANSAVEDAKQSVLNWVLSDIPDGTPVKVLPPDKWAGVEGIVEYKVEDDAPQRVLGKRYSIGFYSNGQCFGGAFYRQNEFEVITDFAKE